MSSQKLFEGPVLEDLLAVISTEVGPEANIVHAERTHKGGVMGFFAREHFRLAVTVPPQGETSTHSPRPKPRDNPRPKPGAKDSGRRTERKVIGRSTEPPAAEASPFAAIAMETSDIVTLGQPPAAATKEMSAAPRGVPERSSVGCSPNATIDSPNLPLAPLTKPNAVTEPVATASTIPSAAMVEPELAGQSPDRPVERFDQALLQVARSLGHDHPLVWSAPHDDDICTSGPAVNEADGTTPDDEPTPDRATADEARIEQVALAGPGPEVGGLSSVAEETSTFAELAESLSHAVTRGGSLAGASRAPLSDEPIVDLVATASTSWHDPGRRPGIERNLSSAGLPRTLFEETMSLFARGGRLDTALVEVLGRIPCRPSLSCSERGVVAVVGRVDRLDPALIAVTGDLGIDSVLLISPSRDHQYCETSTLERARTDAADAMTRAAERSPDGLTLVGVPAGTDRASRSWATEVVRVMKPTAVFGVVDAASKTEDIAAWAAGLGGLDALVVDGLQGTRSPGTLLSLDIPVGWVDGRPATPARWAAIIEDALSE